MNIEKIEEIIDEYLEFQKNNYSELAYQVKDMFMDKKIKEIEGNDDACTRNVSS